MDASQPRSRDPGTIWSQPSCQLRVLSNDHLDPMRAARLRFRVSKYGVGSAKAEYVDIEYVLPDNQLTGTLTRIKGE